MLYDDFVILVPQAWCPAEVAAGWRLRQDAAAAMLARDGRRCAQRKTH